MSDMMKKINDEALENVTGGREVQVRNHEASYANLRTAPGLSSRVKLTLDNGAWVGTTGRKERKDGYTWYEVYVVGAEDCGGWIAGSLIGY